jgi:glycosyltransferase involved in cell wall biosynthesis
MILRRNPRFKQMKNSSLNPTVSVVMSIYKEPIEWISLSIDSILKQTFSDFEFIIINDFPERDENRDVLNKFLLLDDRITIIENKKNIGLTKSLNIGLEHAKGKYIARMDADDISMHTRFEKQYQYMEDNPDCILLGTCAYIIDEAGKKIGKLLYPENHSEIEQTMILKNSLNHPTFFYRKSILEEFDINYSEDYPYAEDYDFGCNLIFKGQVHNLQEKLLKYRKSKQQIGQSKIGFQKRTSNKIRVKYINNLLFSKFNKKNTEDSDLVNVLWGLNKTHPKNIYIKNMFLTLGFYLKGLTFKDRVKIQFCFNLQLIQRLRLTFYK